jgi:ketosteroid isomerase-like protein
MRSFAMKHGPTYLLTAVLACSAVILGQSANKPADQSKTESETAETVSILDHVWLDAAHNRDTGTMAWLFADDFVEVHAGGEAVDKATQIDQIRDPKSQVLELHPDDIQVRYVSPDVAILTDTTTIKGHSGGVAYGGTYRTMRVFVKEKGRWRAAGAGITKITQ